MTQAFELPGAAEALALCDELDEALWEFWQKERRYPDVIEMGPGVLSVLGRLVFPHLIEIRNYKGIKVRPNAELERWELS